MEVNEQNSGSAVQSPENERDEALFSSLQKKQKRRRRRTVRTVILVTAAILLALTAGVLRLRRRVQESLLSVSAVSSSAAQRGSISTTVTGSGTLANVDEEEIKIPSGVVIDEVLVKANEKVREGDTLAALDRSSVLSAMEDMQSAISELDAQIHSARGDSVPGSVTSGVEGTVSKVFAISGDLVTDVMAEHGCLAEILLKNGQTIRVMGLAGTVAQVFAEEGKPVFSGSVLFTLKDTWFSANYDSYVQQRQEKEKLLLQLMQLHRDGALLAPWDGSVSTVDYDKDAEPSKEDSFSVVTMSPDRQMEVVIEVDETNILALSTGQTAKLSIGSIGTDSFSGTVTEISKTAASASGVTRYSATITLDKAPEMLPGMTARAEIAIHGVDNALIIPVEALHQTSASSFVYTSYDPQTGEYGDLREVEAGISNTESVEILSGLAEGEVVYYPAADSNPFARGGSGRRGSAEVRVESRPPAETGGGARP